MRFCYCPACKRLRPYNWYARDECENCNGQCIIFEVKRTIFGKLMYVLSALAAVLLVLHVSWYIVSAEWASFYSSLPSDVSIFLIFALLILAMSITYLDLAKTTRLAEERVSQGISKSK